MLTFSYVNIWSTKLGRKFSPSFTFSLQWEIWSMVSAFLVKETFSESPQGALLPFSRLQFCSKFTAQGVSVSPRTSQAVTLCGGPGPAPHSGSAVWKLQPAHLSFPPLPDLWEGGGIGDIKILLKFSDFF